MREKNGWDEGLNFRSKEKKEQIQQLFLSFYWKQGEGKQKLWDKLCWMAL